MRIFRPAPATEWRQKVAHGKTVGFIIRTSRALEQGGRNVWRLIFCRPIRGWKFFFATRPTVLPWATFCRASGALAGVILFFVTGALAEMTNTLSDAEIQGQQLAQGLCDSRPVENFTNTGVLKIKNSKGDWTNLLIKCELIITGTNWSNSYKIIYPETLDVTQIDVVTFLEIDHYGNKFGRYTKYDGACMGTSVQGDRTYIPFANSDFWLCDLGLEFLHWPVQKVLPKTTNLKRGREYTLLESTNPNPSTNDYSRVVSWIDKETGGILQAEAYDAQGKLLKIFEPKSFKKVDGQWQLQEMQIENVQTRSKTWLEFDLKK